jgi:transcription-repair coupling factor (superfamily II helicase)
LGRAVDALRKGEKADLDKPLNAGVEINMHVPALLPEDYVPDVHLRLMLYKRIASTSDDIELRDLQVELIDRFGLLPQAGKNLLRNAGIKHKAAALGIQKIDVAIKGGYLDFGSESAVDPVVLVKLVQNVGRIYKLKGAQRLQFRTELDDIDKRYAFIEDLIKLLGGNNDAVGAHAS